ncbi:beta strand repeat-containing protein [Sphingomonas fennica]|uniref:Uncharacterized protein n=1 Tax=Edaphosphingomonas fennica TaxID=114404 RepID=A0A2T4I891_9SPHN|nr:hypothetical protein [Sphingomonas fennica]PTD27832.1 hypothetical protein CV103_00865 [Sphingomonas fennica]
MPSISRAARRRLFLGSAIAALSVSIATPALAVGPYAPEIDATGDQVIANNQIVTDAPVDAAASDPIIKTIVLPTESSASLSGNEVRASATANRQSNALEPDALDLMPATDSTHLAATGNDVTAYAPTVIAARQVTEYAPVTADTAFSSVSMLARDVVASQLEITSNRQEALATGNDGANALNLSGGDGSGGAGIAVAQSTGYGSDVSAEMSGIAHILTREVVGSDVRSEGNLQRAVSTGNHAANALSADVLGIESFGSNGPPSMVQPYGEAEVNAAYSVLSAQQTSSDVVADTQGGFQTTTLGSVVEAALRVEANTLAAAAYGNDADNKARLTADSIDVGYNGGAIANVTNSQSAEGATLADADGGTSMLILGDAIGAKIAAEDNSVQAVAIGNRADGNQLAVQATAIRAPEGSNGEEGEGPRIVGTAQYDEFGTLSVSAPFSVQNGQRFEMPVNASAAGSVTQIKTTGGLVDASITAQNNSATAAATGNRAANGLALDGNIVATAADLNSAQVGYGDVQASAGDDYDRAGARIMAHGDVIDSSLQVAGNDVRASAIANDVSNTLAVSGNEISNASGHYDAVAGQEYAGFLAAADYALANFQGLGFAGGNGEEGSETSGYRPLISSDIVGSFEARGGSIIDSSVAIEGNAQVATALANLASNSLSIEATALDDWGGYAPGSALSSAQIAGADLEATSDMRIAATGEVIDGSVAIRDNSNVALAHMNDAVNQAKIEAVQIGELSGADAELFTDPGWPGLAVGDHVLANNQMADGSVTVTAATHGLNGGFDAALTGSRYAIAGNDTGAEAVANQAINELTMLAASAGYASAGMANTQENHAGVLANAITRVGYGASGTSDAQMVVERNTTTALARGNSVLNDLEASGLPVSDFTPASAELTGWGEVSAMAGLASSQLNTGEVVARSQYAVHGVVLNGFGAEGSALALNGNAVSASAIGNNATNIVTLSALGQLPTAAAGTVQVNNGPISAEVSGATFAAVPGHLTASRLGITGNSVTASAVGNSAVTSIASLR